MADVWDSLEADYGGAQQVTAAPQVGGDVWDSLEADYGGAPVAQSRGVMSALGEVGQGLSLGFLPEIEGGTSAISNALSSVFGGGNGAGFMQNYRTKRDASEAELGVFEKENPWGSLGLQVAGGAIPAVAGGVARMGLGAAEAAPGLIGSLAKNVFGIGIKEAPTLGQLAKMGATQGALYGAGNATEGNRLQGAATGGVIGSVLGPVVGKTAELGIGKVADKLAEHGVIGTGLLASERGALGEAGSSLVNYTPEELLLAKELKNTATTKVTAGASELTDAISKDVPLFLPEAVDSPGVFRNAQFIANYDPSIDFSKTAIDARAAGAGGRIDKLMGVMSPAVDPTDVGTGLMNASQSAVEQLKKVRFDATDPMYKALEGRGVPDDIAIDLMDDPIIDAAVKYVGKSPIYQKAIGNADVGSFKYLQLVKERLDDQVAELAGARTGTEAKFVKDARKTVVSALEKLDDYRAVTDRYKELSKPINKLAGTQEESGLLEGILNTERIKAHQAPAELLKLTPTQIESVKATLGEKGEEQLKRSARSLMQDVLEKANENSQPALKLLQNSQMTDKFRAMMGEEAFQKFNAGLALEKRIAQGKNKYFAGSPTQGLQQENADFNKSVGFISKIVGGDYKGAISGLFGGQMPDEVAQGLAKIYFDPKRGSEALGKILPLLEQYATNKSVAGVSGVASGSAASRAAAEATANMLPEQPGAKAGSGLLERVMQGGPSQGNVEKLASSVLSIPEATASETMRPDMPNVKTFNTKVADIAKDLDTDPAHLLAVMNFETGGELDSKTKNKAGSGATGLIQFMPATAKELTGADTKEAAIKILEDLTPTEQLDYVKKYLAPFKGKLDSLDDVYMAVLYPKAIGKDSDYALFKKGTTAYWQNRGLDTDKDGIITKAEASNKVRKYSGVVEA